MFYKLSCGCTVLITKQEHDSDTLVKVIARTVLSCGQEDDIPYFRNSTIYERQYNDMQNLPPNHDTWDKIQKGHPLIGYEQEAIFEQMNTLFINGSKLAEIRRILGITSLEAKTFLRIS